MCGGQELNCDDWITGDDREIVCSNRDTDFFIINLCYKSPTYWRGLKYSEKLCDEIYGERPR